MRHLTQILAISLLHHVMDILHVPVQQKSYTIAPLSRHPMVIRSKMNSIKPKVFTPYIIPYPCLLMKLCLLVGQVIKHPHWYHVMSEEFNTLLSNNTWSLVPLSSNQKAIECQLLFQSKYKPDSSNDRYKVRLVAKGFIQGEALIMWRCLV